MNFNTSINKGPSSFTYDQVAAGSNQLFTGLIDGVDNIFSEKL